MDLRTIEYVVSGMVQLGRRNLRVRWITSSNDRMTTGMKDKVEIVAKPKYTRLKGPGPEKYRFQDGVHDDENV